MSKHPASLSASGSLNRLRALVMVAAAAIGLAGCASSLPSLTSPSLAPADKPLEETRAAETPAAAAVAPAAVAKPVPVTMGAIGGAPAAISGKLGKKLQTALAARNITVVKSGGVYALKGIVTAFAEDKSAKVAYVWDIESGGKRQKRISGDNTYSGGKPGDVWSAVDDKALDAMADAAAAQVSAFVAQNDGSYVAAAEGAEKVRANRVASASATSDAVPAQPAVRREMLAMVVPVSGAPGDGGDSLTAAMRNSLRAKGVKLTSKATDSVYQIRGLVEVGAAKGGEQPITIDWRIYAPNGKRLDAVVQKNKLPAGAVDGAWGEIASLAADGAADDIVLVLNKSTAQM